MSLAPSLVRSDNCYAGTQPSSTTHPQKKKKRTKRSKRLCTSPSPQTRAVNNEHRARSSASSQAFEPRSEVHDPFKSSRRLYPAPRGGVGKHSRKLSVSSRASCNARIHYRRSTRAHLDSPRTDSEEADVQSKRTAGGNLEGSTAPVQNACPPLTPGSLINTEPTMPR